MKTVKDKIVSELDKAIGQKVWIEACDPIEGEIQCKVHEATCSNVKDPIPALIDKKNWK